MTRDEIIAIAHEAGIPQDNISALAYGCKETGAELLERFAAMVATKERNRIADEAQYIIKRAEARGAAAEREACAMVCEESTGTVSMFISLRATQYHNHAVKGCAAAIRARKDQ